MKTRTVRINVVINTFEDVTADDLELTEEEFEAIYKNKIIAYCLELELTEEEFEAIDKNKIIAYCLEHDMIQQIIDESLCSVAITSFQYVTESDEDDDEED